MGYILVTSRRILSLMGDVATPMTTPVIIDDFSWDGIGTRGLTPTPVHYDSKSCLESKDSSLRPDEEELDSYSVFVPLGSTQYGGELCPFLTARTKLHPVVTSAIPVDSMMDVERPFSTDKTPLPDHSSGPRFLEDLFPRGVASSTLLCEDHLSVESTAAHSSEALHGPRLGGNQAWAYLVPIPYGRELRSYGFKGADEGLRMRIPISAKLGARTSPPPASPTDGDVNILAPVTTWRGEEAPAQDSSSERRKPRAVIQGSSDAQNMSNSISDERVRSGEKRIEEALVTAPERKEQRGLTLDPVALRQTDPSLCERVSDERNVVRSSVRRLGLRIPVVQIQDTHLAR